MVAEPARERYPPSKGSVVEADLINHFPFSIENAVAASVREGSHPSSESIAEADFVDYLLSSAKVVLSATVNRPPYSDAVSPLSKTFSQCSLSHLVPSAMAATASH